MDNLPELRDIHLPADEIPIFPLAYGWWGLLAVIICTAVLLKTIFWAYKTSMRIYTRKLIFSLRTKADLKSVVKMSEILRRICVGKYPQAVALSGNEWIEFLNKNSREKINGEAAELLKNAPFVPENSSLFNLHNYQQLWKFCYDWAGDNI